MSLTFEQAKEVHRVLADHRAVYPLLRRWASDRVLETCPDIGEIGSSDVSIELTEALRFYEAPLIGPVIDAYVACGYPVPPFDQHGPVFTP